jgi:hypothetical protein
MSKLLSLSAAAAAMIFLSLAGPTGAAEPTDTADNKRDFAALSCKDVMRLSGEERDLALAFAHGYMLGKKGTTQYDVDVLARITDQFIDHCLDHPAENALKSFEKFAK